MSGRSGMRVAVPLALALLALARLATSHEPDTVEVAPPPIVTADALAVVDGLRVGDELGGFVVERVAGPVDQKIVVELERGDVGLRLFVSRLGSGPGEAPVAADGFELRYGPPSPETAREPADDTEALDAASDLGERIESSGADVPTWM